MKFTVVLTEDQQGNVFATAPGLPDCSVKAANRQDVLRRMRQTIAAIISQSEILQLDVAVEPKTSGKQHETPWEFFGAYPDHPGWGQFFDEIEQARGRE